MLALPFLLSFVLSLALVPAVRWLGFRLGKVYQPRSDRWHSRPTPTLGGIGIFLAFLISLLVSFGVEREWSGFNWSLLAGSALMFGLGLLDDLRRLAPPTKLVVQFLAAAIVIFFGRVIDFFPWDIANYILTFFWLVGITNAINLLDNMDGLAGGISLIATLFLGYFFLSGSNLSLLLIALSLGGSILGFLFFNFPPAKIFMGDAGSLFLGFTLASLAVAHRPRASDVFSVMGVPLLLFLLPIFDTSLVTITRLLRGQSPSQGGTDHTSHRLIAFGLSERQAVLFMYLVALLSGVAGLTLEALDYDLSLVLIPILLITFSLLTAYLGRLKVVTSYTPTPTNISRLMADLAYKRRLLEIILDFFLIGACYYLAFWTSHGFRLESNDLSLFIHSLPVSLAGSYISFFAFGIYRGVWRYIGVDDLMLFGRATIGAVLLTAIPLLIFYSTAQYSPVIFFLYAVFLIMGLAMSRGSFRILDRIYDRQRAKAKSMNVLLYGAEDAGEIALRWLLQNPDLGYQPVGFLDDDRFNWGKRIHGVTILGGGELIESVMEDKHIDGVIFTSPVLLSTEPAQKVQEICRRKGVWVRVLKLDIALVE